MKTWIKEVMTGITDYGKVLRKRRCQKINTGDELKVQDSEAGSRVKDASQGPTNPKVVLLHTEK